MSRLYRSSNQQKQPNQEQPNNAIVLAGYFLATTMTEGGACKFYYNKGYEALPLDEATDDSSQEPLLTAHKTAPKLRIAYAVDGEDQSTFLIYEQ